MFETVGRRRDSEAAWRYAMAGCGTTVLSQIAASGLAVAFFGRWLWRMFWLALATLLQRPDFEIAQIEVPEIEEVAKIELDLGTPVEVPDPELEAPVYHAPKPVLAMQEARAMSLMALLTTDSHSGVLAMLGSTSGDVFGNSLMDSSQVGSFGLIGASSGVAIGGLGARAGGQGGGGTAEGLGGLGGLATIGHGGGGGTGVGYGTLGSRGVAGSARLVTRSPAVYPQSARDADLGEVTCRVQVVVTEGRPDPNPSVTGCPSDFRDEALRVARESSYDGSGTLRLPVRFTP